MKRAGYRVSEVARLSRVSVRALHHYDAIGLLRPSGRTDAGYRLYSASDLERLQEVLFFRELGFALEEIRRIVDDPRFDRREALRMQRRLLCQRRDRTEAMLAAVDKALAALEGGVQMTKEEMFEVFGDFAPSQYEQEVKDRWGDTDAYRESKKRTARYGKNEWKAIKEQGSAIQERMAALLAKRASAESAEAMAVAEEHRAYIERWFYPCSREMHAGLGGLYVTDPRFTANIDSVRPGLAAFMREAFRANARRGAGNPA